MTIIANVPAQLSEQVEINRGGLESRDITVEPGANGSWKITFPEGSTLQVVRTERGEEFYRVSLAEQDRAESHPFWTFDTSMVSIG